MSACDTPRSNWVIHDASPALSSSARRRSMASSESGGDVAFAAREREQAVADAGEEILDTLQAVGVRRGRRVGPHERELEQRQQAHLLASAVVARDAVEAASRELAVERQQAVEALRRVGVDRVGAVAQPRAVFGDLALRRFQVPLGSFRVAQHLAQPSAVDVGVGEVGVEVDGRGVVRDGLLQFAQLGVNPRPVVVNQHVVGRVERHAVVILQRAVVVADLRAQHGAVEVGQRVGRIEPDHLVEVGEGLHRTVGRVIDQRAVEVGEQVVRIAPDGLVEVRLGLFVLLLLQMEPAPAVVAVGVFAVGADRQVEVVVGARGVFEVEVAQAPADVGVGHLGLLPDEHVEVVDRLAELLIEQPRDAAAVVGARQVGPQLDRLAEILQGVVVVPQPRARDGAVGVGLRIDRVEADRRGEVGLGAQQVVEVVFGDAAQEIAFVGLFVEAQQRVERAYGLLVVVVHHARPPDPEEILSVVLCLRPDTAQQRPRKEDSDDEFPQFFAHAASQTCFSVRLLFQLVTEAPQLAVVVAPVLADLDEELQEHFLLEELLHVLARGLPDTLELFALVADQDAFLRLARDVDRRRDAVDRRFLAVAFDFDLAAVGYLLVVEAQDLFADDFRGEEPQRLVRERVFGVEGRAFGQQVENRPEHALDVEALPGRYRHDPRRGNLRLPFPDQRVERRRRREVDLVDDHDRRDAAAVDAVDDPGRAFALLDGVGDVEYHVGVGQRARDELHHRLLQFVRGFEDARRVGIDDLEVVARDDAHDAVARGLRLGGDDREPFADEGVHQRRFPDVGVADDIYEAGFVHGAVRDMIRTKVAIK